MFRRVVASVAALFLSASMLGACTTENTTIAEAPAGDAFWEGPESLEGHTAGDLIWSREYDGPFALEGAENHLVLYAQDGVRGDLVGTSGVVAIPKGTPPEGGWPVISWAHGTTGIADQCAPSRIEWEGANDWMNRLLLQPLVDSGHVVVQTDYEGLGTPGDHPYLIGSSEGRAVLDIVRAARQLDPEIGNAVALAGHSQGGHAALWAATMGERAGSDLDIRGVAVFAPASNLALVIDVVLSGGADAPPAMIAMVLRGLQIAYPDDITPEDLLTPAAMKVYPRTLDTCLSGLFAKDAFGDMTIEEFGDLEADLDHIKAKLNANDPGFPTIKAPILVTQGGRDVTVPQILTDFLVESWEKRDFDVKYKVHRKADHLSVVDASAERVREFLENSFTAAK